MRKKERKIKYMKALFTIPDHVYTQFKEIAPGGARSQIITRFITQYIEIHKPDKAVLTPSLWVELKKYRKKRYPKLNLKKLIKDAWNNVD